MSMGKVFQVLLYPVLADKGIKKVRQSQELPQLRRKHWPVKGKKKRSRM
jgi:hypothetical protein